MTYEYLIRSTHASSDKYGVCEICGKHASEVFMQKKRKPSEKFPDIKIIGSLTFGHKKCLIDLREE